MKKVVPGDALNIPATTYNAFIDAAKANQVKGQPGGRSKTTRGQTVLVKNSSGTDVGRFGVLGIDGVVFDPNDSLAEFQNNWALECVTPLSPDHDGKFVVTAEPIADGKIGTAHVSGTSAVQIDMVSADHDYADITDGDNTKLTSADDGAVRILYVESGTGTKWAVVRFDAGNVVAPPWVGYGIPAEGEVDSIWGNNYINLEITDSDGTPLYDPTEFIRVHKNAAQRTLYVHFTSSTVFRYVLYNASVGVNEVGGCIFSRTEAFLSNDTYLPTDGYNINDPALTVPSSTDITGSAGNEDHYHVIGHMYLKDVGANIKAWRPWIVIDPSELQATHQVLDNNVHDDTIDHTPVEGDIIYCASGGTWTYLGKGVDNQVLKMNGAVPNWETLPGGGVGNHQVLDANVHTDTLDMSPVLGSIVVGNSTPKWTALGVTNNGVMISDSDADNDIKWETSASTYHILQKKADGKIGFDVLRFI